MTEQEREELIVKIERDALREENAGLRADLATEKEQGWKAHAANLSLEEDNHALREELTAMERRARIFESANKKMLADNKRLREELAAYRARKPVVYSPDAQAMSDRVKAAEAERDALREENARLREVLKPFAEIAESLPHRNNTVTANVLMSDLRAAAAAIRRGKHD
jgi:hypothetical protein